VSAQIPSFELRGQGRAGVSGPLSFATAGALLEPGAKFIQGGEADSIDLAGVQGADSAGLALLIEWLSLAQVSGRPLRYLNIPNQLMQLARLCDVEPLISGGG
jgi:phospholipid transport system transporter-binding protein